MTQAVFPAASRRTFADCYPEAPAVFRHELGSHELMTLESLAKLAECMPSKLVECVDADQPIGVDGQPEETGRSGSETIRTIESCKSWVMLKHGDKHHPGYRQLLEDLLSEFRPEIELRTGRMLGLESFIFITSAGGTTPYHFDPEHNILMQVRGSKVLTTFPPSDTRFAPDEMHETFHLGGRPELSWRDDMAAGGTPHSLTPGDALYVPVMSPHFVKNGPEISISLSITWRSEWSFAEADARAFNSVLRRVGIDPAPPKRWPARNMTKAMAWRTLRRVPGIH